MNRRGFLKFLGAAGVCAVTPISLQAIAKTETDNKEFVRQIGNLTYSTMFHAPYMAYLHTYRWKVSGGYFEYSFLVEPDLNPQAKEALLSMYREEAFHTYTKRYGLEA